MINPIWESTLVKYFTTLKDIDDDIEQIKCELAKSPHFNVGDLYKQIDIDAKVFLSLNDFKAFLNRKGISYEEASLRRFIHNYDKDGDFALSYDEFKEVVLPHKNESVRNDVASRKEGECKEDEVNAVEEIFVKVVEKEMEMVKLLSDIANELKTSKDFTTYESFLAIVHDEKYITESNMEKFLKEHDISFKYDDIKGVLFRLDGDGDGMVSYEEFLEIFFPYSNVVSVKTRHYDIGESKYDGYKTRNASYKNENANWSGDVSGSVPSISRFISSGRKMKESEPSVNKSEESYKEKVKKYDYDKIDLPQREVSNDYKMKLISYGTPKENNQTRNTKNEEHINSTSMSLSANSPNKTCQLRRQSPSCYFEKATSNSPSRTNVLHSSSPSQHPIPITQCCHHCCHKPCCCCSPQIQKRVSLYNLLNDFITQDSKIEEIKESLAFCSDANLQDLFSFFDYSQTSSISPLDLCESLKELNLYLSIDELKLLFARYDKNNDGKLDYEEFCDMILPRKYSIAKLMNERYPPNYFMGFNSETKNYIVELFNAMICGEKSNERYRKMLIAVNNFSPFDSFNMIKRSVNNGIYKEDLDAFMNDNGRYLSLFESELLFLRLDKDQDGVICYSEYLGEVASKN